MLVSWHQRCNSRFAELHLELIPKLSLGNKTQTVLYKVILHIEDVAPKKVTPKEEKPQNTKQEDSQAAMMSMLLSNFSSLRTSEPFVIPPEVSQYIPDKARAPSTQHINDTRPTPTHNEPTVYKQPATPPQLTESDVQRIVDKAVMDMETRINNKIDQATADIKKFIQDALSAKQS